MVAFPRMATVALDLGTSNAVAAVLNGGCPKLVPLLGGAFGISSAVAMDEKGRWLVGRDARAQLLSRPAHTVVGVKTLLGRSVQTTAFRLDAGMFGYRIEDGPNGPAAILDDVALPLIDAAGMILGVVRGQAQDSLGLQLREAVMPVPAYFTDEQRGAFAAAACRGGIEKAWVVDETEALVSLLGASRRRRHEKTVFLYGLGGGVFDAALLESNGNGGYEVIASSGESLGGLHFDRRLAGYLTENFLVSHMLGGFEHLVGQQRILEAAEAAKIRLDETDSTPVVLPFLDMDSQGAPLDLRCELTREDLVRLTGDVVLRTLSVCRSVLRAARVEPSEIDAVYLYGRSTKSREILAGTSRLFGRVPIRLPDDATALGAAVMAGQ